VAAAASVGASVAAGGSVGAAVMETTASVGAGVEAGASVGGAPQAANNPTTKMDTTIFTYIDFIFCLLLKGNCFVYKEHKKIKTLCALCGKTHT
jgi:hypothetical protein